MRPPAFGRPSPLPYHINLVIPAKAGIQERHLENRPLWIPAFAGMTKEKLCRTHRPVPERKPVARRHISLSPALSHLREREKCKIHSYMLKHSMFFWQKNIAKTVKSMASSYQFRSESVQQKRQICDFLYAN